MLSHVPVSQQLPFDLRGFCGFMLKHVVSATVPFDPVVLCCLATVPFDPGCVAACFMLSQNVKSIRDDSLVSVGDHRLMSVF